MHAFRFSRRVRANGDCGGRCGKDRPDCTDKVCGGRLFDGRAVSDRDGRSKFTERIDENPLDTAYEKERQSAVTTQDFCAVEEKYAQLWQTELQRSLDDLYGYLTADDKAKLAKQQESWAAFALSETAVNKEILENDGYAVRLGSASAYQFLSERRALIRERTVKIKYLTYLLETQTENPTAAEKQMWSQFGSAMSEKVLADE